MLPFLGGDRCPRLCGAYCFVGHAFQGCAPPQLPQTCWRPLGQGDAHERASDGAGLGLPAELLERRLFAVDRAVG